MSTGLSGKTIYTIRMLNPQFNSHILVYTAYHRVKGRIILAVTEITKNDILFSS
jgi:hypothetical protein